MLKPHCVSGKTPGKLPIAHLIKSGKMKIRELGVFTLMVLGKTQLNRMALPRKIK
jgi:hypothetical protein